VDDAAPARRETYVDLLGDAVLSSAVALPLGSLTYSAIYLSVVQFGSAGFGWSIIPGSFFLAIVAVLFGVIPAVLVGAPIYAAIAYRGWANYLSALIVGTLVGAVLLQSLAGNSSVLTYMYPYPISVAVLTHYFARRRRVRRIGVATS
jgi:hypothetical protein